MWFYRQRNECWPLAHEDAVRGEVCWGLQVLCVNCPVTLFSFSWEQSLKPFLLIHGLDTFEEFRLVTLWNIPPVGLSEASSRLDSALLPCQKSPKWYCVLPGDSHQEAPESRVSAYLVRLILITWSRRHTPGFTTVQLVFLFAMSKYLVRRYS